MLEQSIRGRDQCRSIFLIKRSKSIGMPSTLILTIVFLTISPNSFAYAFTTGHGPLDYLFYGFLAVVFVAEGVRRKVIGRFDVVLIIGLICWFVFAYSVDNGLI
jgi:hypothetical protein